MRQHRQGLTLVELLIALSLLGVFALLAFRLLGENFHLTAATRTANDNSARFDDALRRLRADVSDSSLVEMTQPNTLVIRGPGTSITEWQCDQRTLWQKTGDANHSWNVGHCVTLKLDGAVVLLTVDSMEPIAMACIHPPNTGGRP